MDVCRLHEVNDTVSIEAGDGNRVQFTAETDGAYTPSVGDFSRLSKAGNGTFTWTQADMFIRVFDANGRQTSVSDPIGNTTTMTYDANGELLTVTDPVGKVTTFTYNDSSRFTSIADPFGRKTTFETDAHGDLTKITNPDGTARTFTYDAQHRMTQQTDAAGNQTQYTYNASNQITRVDRADGSNTLYNTETAQNLINNLPSGSATESNPLSLADRTAPSYTDGAGNTYTFATNPFGTRTSITDPMGRTTVMNRNGDDQVISLVTPSGNTVSYE
ncbi:MAG: RHS repeat protein, partial [Phycisphaerae bacterium]|nr:RHS repeat protein [Phycisphaerae bacterium]